MKILIRDRQRHRSLNKARVNKAGRKILSILKQPEAEVSLFFVGDIRMKQLNAAYRGINKTTDVLSFEAAIPVKCAANHVLGDIVINVSRAESQAKLYGLGFYDEICRLLAHGILHLLGHDHEGSAHRAKVMIKKEREIFNAVKEMD
ncbi:MAG: rRNA maturation RNase YbeY [Nitrospiraceae bacterium]|nr:MAG: rRNA maturation RNase YbeY [Nitrospiraceae bacterium]